MISISGFRREQRQQRPAAADLDVVGVAADREHALDTLGAVDRQGVHDYATSAVGDVSGTPRGARHGALPDSRRLSSTCLSFSVSIGAQNPSYG